MIYENKKVCNILFRRIPTITLVTLLDESKRHYMSDVSKNIDATYSHAVKMFQSFERLKLVTLKKEGRNRYVKLTDKGSSIAKYLQAILLLDED